MKKILFLAVALLGLAISAKAVDLEGGPSPFLSTFGGGMNPNSAIIHGKNPKDLSSAGFIAYADVNITAGDVVIISTGTTYPVSVSKTTTTADPRAIGVAITTASYGTKVQVATRGVVRGKIGQTTAIGAIYTTGGTAGLLVPVTLTAEALFTGLSKTAAIFRCLETKTYSASDPYVVGQVLGY
jgi:hypothetical protein